MTNLVVRLLLDGHEIINRHDPDGLMLLEVDGTVMSYRTNQLIHDAYAEADKQGLIVTRARNEPDAWNVVLVNTQDERNFRWAYQLLIVLAKKLLDEANAKVDEYDRREWSDLNGSSQSIWLHKARELAGIDHEEFLAPIRSGQYNVADIYYGGK